MAQSFNDLQNAVVLAELGGHSNGPYCARYGKGAALVMMGTYVIDPSDNVPYPKDFVFKPGPENYSAYLCEHVQLARQSGAKVGVSAISVEPHDTVDFLITAERAGADYVSLCAYSTMEMFTLKGLGCRLIEPENRPQLKTWIKEILDAVRIPLIFKFGIPDGIAVLQTVEALSAMGVPILHAVANNAAEPKNLSILKNLAQKCPFLIAGGGIGDVDSARLVLSNGAGAVAVATAAMKNPDFSGYLQRHLRM